MFLLPEALYSKKFARKMKLSRRSRFFTVLLALVSLLFTQLAVAAYACPSQNLQQMHDMASVSAVHAGMSGCEGMDMEQPSLCHAHDQTGNQSLDKPETPHVAPFMPAALLLAVIALDVTVPATALPPEIQLLQRATSPPLAIRNCCFRF
jgi:hypothetical protein